MSKSKIGFYPESFNPFHIGHYNIISKAFATGLFDEIIIGVGCNPEKLTSEYIPHEERAALIEAAYKFSLNKVSVINFTGLTVDAAREVNAGVIIRGLRDTNDYTEELTLDRWNTRLNTYIPTIYLNSDLEFSFISSGAIRLLYKLGRFEEANKYIFKDTKDYFEKYIYTILRD